MARYYFLPCRAFVSPFLRDIVACLARGRNYSIQTAKGHKCRRPMDEAYGEEGGAAAEGGSNDLTY